MLALTCFVQKNTLDQGCAVTQPWWLSGLNSSRESPEGPEFESHSRHVYMVPHNLLQMEPLYTADGIWY